MYKQPKTEKVALQSNTVNMQPGVLTVSPNDGGYNPIHDEMTGN